MGSIAKKIASLAAMKNRKALQELTQLTTEQVNRLSPEEKAQLQQDVLKQFGLPPLATLRTRAAEALVFVLIGALLVAVAAFLTGSGNIVRNALASLITGLIYGSLSGFAIWIVYRLARFLGIS